MGRVLGRGRSGLSGFIRPWRDSLTLSEILSQTANCIRVCSGQDPSVKEQSNSRGRYAWADLRCGFT